MGMAVKCIESIAIEKDKEIGLPEGVNCFRERSGRFIASHANPSLPKGYRWVPKGSTKVKYPEYREHGDRWIHYGEPIFS